MSPATVSHPPRSDPAPEYRARLVARQEQAEELDHRCRVVGYARLVLAVFAVGLLVVAGVRGSEWPWGRLLPLAAAFLLLVLVHDGLIRRRDAARRAVALYREGLRRVEGRPTGPDGAAFADPAHPYAGDLDLFGPGSLFQRICLCRTLHGEEALARRLCGAAPSPPGAAEARCRQEAVREVLPALDLREALAEAGQAARESGREHRMVLDWAAAEPAFRRMAPLRATALLLPPPLLAATVWGLAGGPWWPAGMAVLPVLALYAATRARAHAVLSRVGTPERVLGNYQRMARVVEDAALAAAELRRLRGSLASGRAPASRELGRLRRLVAWGDALRNQIVAALAPFLLYDLHVALSLEGWRRRCGAALPAWLEALGEVEAVSSLAAYAYEHPAHTFPGIRDDGPPSFEAVGLGHPLLDPARSVPNDVALDGPGTLVMVSGSNMSGKSTLLRSVGVATVLAMAGTTVCARRLSLSPMAVATSMRVIDSIQEGTSHFMAELHRLKQVTDLAGSGRPLLYLLDEILHGTNSRERLLGARAVAAHLLGSGAMGLVTTHDLALADLESEHRGRVRNVHFADHLEDGAVRFDYRMRPGVVRTTNALRLMRSVGIPVGPAPGEAP